jgi:spore maturation protein SpmB
MSILLTISDFMIQVAILFIVVFGCLQKVDIYEVFLEGAKIGLQTVVDILPTLIGLVMAVEVIRAGGLLDILVELFRPFAEVMGFPAELAPLSIVRLVSSTAATGLLTDLFASYGPDSFFGTYSLCDDELHRNGVLHHEPVFSLGWYQKNQVDITLCIAGQCCWHVYGGMAGAVGFLK